MGVKQAARASPSPSRTKQSFLVTDAGFARSLLLNLVAMASVSLACVSYQPLYEYGEAVHGFVTAQMMHGAHRMAWWSLLGLLSSSCCALQIMLNAFSFGCAGFNTALGPWRPTFVALTVTVQTISWCVAWNRPYQWPPTAAATLLAFALTFLPELLDLRVARRESLALEAAASYDNAGGTAVRLQLSSLGCAACIEKVSTVLDGISGVRAKQSPPQLNSPGGVLRGCLCVAGEQSPRVPR